MIYCKKSWAEINLDALSYNYNTIRDLCGDAKIMAVVKADGYGHGAVFVSEFLEKSGVDFLGVSGLTEALELRNNGIKSPILILGYTNPEYASLLSSNNISQAVFSAEYAEKLSAQAKENNCTLKIHIKLNTGMNRLGFDCTNKQAADIAAKEIAKVLKLEGLYFEGLFTHFAAADRSGDKSGEFTNKQFKLFEYLSESLGNNEFLPKIKHCCNSAATLLNPKMHQNLVRTGIILYGLKPDRDLELPIKLKPVMELKSVVSMIHTLRKGEGTSYGLSFKAKKDIKVATIAIGYADGYPRALSNKGRVLINGQFANIIGKVCMDQLIVDITDIKDVSEGDEVILFGKSGENEITVDEVAEMSGTINYEIVCGISRRIPRYYLKDGKTVGALDYISK